MRPQGGRDISYVRAGPSQPLGGAEREPLIVEPVDVSAVRAGPSLPLGGAEVEPLDPEPSFVCETAKSLVATVLAVAVAIGLTAILGYLFGGTS